MNSKKTNWLFLAIILVHFAVIGILVFTGSLNSLSMLSNLVISELIILLPGVVCLLVTKSGFGESLGFHKIKISSVLMIVLFTFLCMPFVTVLNSISMFFVENAVYAMQDNILEMGFPAMLLLMGIYGPFCEEFVFRGVIYRGYKKSGSVFWAILLSALLFGLMHLNFNQALYAFALGILLALLVEATGSLWASVICHMVFNSQQVCLMFFSQWLSGTAYGKMAEAETAEVLTTETLTMALSVYLVIAAVTLPLAICVLAWIAKNENRAEALRQIWAKRKEKKEYLISIPLVIAIVISIAYMSLELFL